MTMLRETRELQPADAILVFAAGLWHGKPSLAMRVRVQRAAELYDQGLAPVILCSGGYSGGLSEARVMRSLLAELGVPPDAVIPDDQGASTRRAIRSARRFGIGRWNRVIAVTSSYHLKRVEEEARRQGLNVIAVAAAAPEGTKGRAAFKRKQRLREMVASRAYALSAGIDAVAGKSILVRAARHLRARVGFLASGADAVAASGEEIAQFIKERVAGFSDTESVHTPASGLCWPVRGLKGHGFGMRHGRLHSGLDIRGAYGAEVRAAAGGRILFAGWMDAYGNVVIVHHGGGLATVYGHLAGIVVGEGESAEEGRILGFVGETGRSSGPHLHFEVRVHGSPVDPLVYLRTQEADVDGARFRNNAAWTGSIYLRGHDPRKPRRLLSDSMIDDLAERLTVTGIRYAYLFAGPFNDDGTLPAYASGATARRTVERLKARAPDLVLLPWIGGVQHATVHLENERWVENAIDSAAQLVKQLPVPGLHIDIEFVVPEADYVVREKKLPDARRGMAEYGGRHVAFHRGLRQRLPGHFLSTVIPSTSSLISGWKVQHTPDEAATLAESVNQLALLHYDTSIADRDTFRASLVRQLEHVAAWKARAESAQVQCLLGLGTFLNPRPLRRYRKRDIESMEPFFEALEHAVAVAEDRVPLVDGIAIYSEWTTTPRDWGQFRELWSDRHDGAEGRGPKVRERQRGG